MAETDEITVMFTGGLDTTLAAAFLGQQYRRVHLLTFCNGFCMGAERNPQKRVKELKRILGEERFSHEVIYVSELFKRLREGFGGFMRQAIKYHSPLVFDLCCRLSMDTRTVVYNLQHGIRYVADGNSKSQTEIFIQREEYTAEIRRFMGEYGVEYVMPVYDFGDREARRQALRDMGFESGNRTLAFLQELGFNNFSDQLGKQPLCYAAWGPALLTSPIRDWPVIRSFQLSVEDAIELRHDREKIAKAYIEEYFRERFMDVDEILAQREAVQQEAD